MKIGKEQIPQSMFIDMSGVNIEKDWLWLL